MIGVFTDLFINFIRLGGNDEQSLFLITSVQKVQNLGGSKLKDNGIQRFVPAEQIAGDRKNNTVSGKNIIPCFDTVFFREKDGDKVGAPAGGMGIEADGDRAGVKDTAEYTDEQDVIRHLKTGEDIRKKTRQDDHQTGISGKFFPDMFKTDEHRDGIQREIDQGIGKLDIPEVPCDLLEQQSQAIEAPGQKVSCPDKTFDIHSHQKGCGCDEHCSFYIIQNGIFFHNRTYAFLHFFR